MVTSDHSVYCRYILNSHTIVCLDISGDTYRIPQTVGLFHRIKHNLKSRPFIILHPYGNSRFILYFNHEVAIEANSRQYKFCCKRAELIGVHTLLHQLFPVHIQQSYQVILSCQDMSRIGCLFIRNPFDVDSLTGTIQRTVGQQSDMLCRARFTTFVISIQINALGQHSSIRPFACHIAADSFIPFYNSLSTGVSGNILQQFTIFFIISGIETNFCAGNGLPATAIYRNHFHFIVRQSQCQHLEASRNKELVCRTGCYGIGYNLQYINARFIGYI